MVLNLITGKKMLANKADFLGHLELMEYKGGVKSKPWEVN